VGRLGLFLPLFGRSELDDFLVHLMPALFAFDKGCGDLAKLDVHALGRSLEDLECFLSGAPLAGHENAARFTDELTRIDRRIQVLALSGSRERNSRVRCEHRTDRMVV
jgi:hypothetical protein